MVSVLLLLAGTAVADPRPVLRTPRWEPVPTDPESRGVLGETEVRLARVPGPDPLRAQCGPNDVPRRLAVLDGGLVDGPFSVPVRDESGWVFPPAPEGLGTWLVTPAGCDLYVLAADVTAEALAHAERGRSDEEWRAVLDAEPVFAAEAARWMSDGAGLDRYVALRPSGPQPPGWTWWSGEGDEPFTVRGPRRLRVEARWVGEPRPICLTVDGTTSCASTGPDEHQALRDGHLARVPEVRDGQAVGRIAMWSVLLPRGSHVVSVDGPAEVRLVGTWPVLYTDGGGLVEPAAIEVFSEAAPDERAAVDPDGAPESEILLGPTTTPIAPTDVRWVPLDDPGLALATRVDEIGVLTLHLLPESDGPCTVTLPDGQSWRARPREAVQRFLWTGTAESGGWPVVDGCDARVRVRGLSEAEGAWVGSRWWSTWPGGTLSWAHVGGDARLFLRHPPDQVRPYRVQITHPSGRVEQWTIDPRTVPADRWTPSGAAWQPSLDLALEPGPGEARVWSEVPLLARLTAYQDPQDPLPRPQSEPVPSASQQAEIRDLRTLSAAIAAAPEAHARAQALLDRARTLEALGEVRLAWTDIERAAALDATIAEENPLSDRLRRITAALVHGLDRWVPDDPLWVPASAPPAVDERAAKGDWLGVATLLRQAGTDPRVWWREAVVAGQIATPAQRIDAYTDLVRYTPASEVEHPWLWPLRVLSGWERLVQVRGAGPAAAPWPEIESDAPDLFPDAWPATEIQPIPEGFEVTLPDAGGLDLPVRCLTTRLEAPADGCRFAALDVGGDVLAEARVDGWGTPGVLPIPAGAGTVHVAVRPAGGVRAQIRSTAGARRDRTAWPVGDPVSFDLLGPTVLRLETWLPAGDHATLDVTIGLATTVVEVGSQSDVRLPIDTAGPVHISVRPSAPLWLVPSIRVAEASSREARDDRLWLRVGAATGAPLPPPTPLAAPWTAPTGRPPQNPALTAYVRAGGGTTELDDLQTDPDAPTSWGALAAIGVASRPAPGTWWIDVSARGDLGSAPLFSADALVEGLVVKRAWRLWVWGRAEVVRGLDPAAPMTTAFGAVRVTADAWPWPRWQLSGRVQADVRGILSGFWDPFVYGKEPKLWSDYKDDHRAAVELTARARFFEPPWFDAAGEAWILTNEKVVEPLEAYGATAWAEWSRPSLQFRGGVELERRLADADRDVGYWSPAVFLRGALTTWPDRDLALQPRASIRYRIYYADVEVLFELRAYMSRDRALRDIPPSRLPTGFVHEWEQDGAAARKRTTP